MEDRDFRGWQVTPEQADKIAAGDVIEMNGFYNLNMSRLRAMAYAYARRHNQDSEFRSYYAEDMVVQLFLDLPYLNWKNALTLTMSIKQTSFAWSAYGGYAQRVAQGLPHSHKFAPWEWYPEDVAGDRYASDDADGETVFGLMVAPEEDRPDNILLKSEERVLTASEICKKLEPILTEHQSNILFLYLEGYTFSQIQEKLELKDRSFLSNLTFKLTLQYREVIELLYSDRDLPENLDKAVPSRFEQFRALDAGRKARRAAKRAKDRQNRPNQRKTRASV